MTKTLGVTKKRFISDCQLLQIQQILLERPHLVCDHFYLATSIQNEAEDIGHLKYML